MNDTGEESSDVEKNGARVRLKYWGKRFGWAAFAFYLVKGLVWLVIGLGAWSLFK